MDDNLSNFVILSLWISLGNDMVGYYPILMILGNSWSLVILIFSIVICPKTKLYGVGRVKKPNLKIGNQSHSFDGFRNLF